MDALVELFKTRAEAVNAEVHRFARMQEASDFIAEFLLRENAEALWVDGPDMARESAANAKVGISKMDWAIAETGTLVQDASPIERRLVSTLPPIHIALIATSRLLPNLAAVIAKLQPKQASYISMITGPSRTADIERVLTIGVHGPGRLIILFVDELGTN